MRDLVIFLPILWFCVVGLRHPAIGIIGWTWVSIMSPQRMAYGWLNHFPVAAMVGGATLLGLFFTRDERRFSFNGENTTLLVFMIWMCITLLFSRFFDDSYPMWLRVMKIDFMILVATALIHSRKHITMLIWILVISIGFYGFKGGVFTILTGGRNRVWGPEDTFIGGNNEVALAITIVIPLIRYLQLHGGFKGKLYNWGMTAWMVLCTLAALGSQSRGALLAVSAMGFMFWIRSQKKALIGVVLVIMAVALVSFMPKSWTERMQTTKSYEQDSSAMGRINAWWMAFNAAKELPFGTGFENARLEWFALYAPVPNDIHAPHSIFFQVMGEHGFIGLLLYLILFTLIWKRGTELRKVAKIHPEAHWCADLGALSHVSLMAYFVGGAFLNLPYWDLPYNVMVVLIAARTWVVQRRWEKEPELRMLPLVDVSEKGRRAA